MSYNYDDFFGEGEGKDEGEEKPVWKYDLESELRKDSYERPEMLEEMSAKGTFFLIHR